MNMNRRLTTSTSDGLSQTINKVEEYFFTVVLNKPDSVDRNETIQKVLQSLAFMNSLIACKRLGVIPEVPATVH